MILTAVNSYTQKERAEMVARHMDQAATDRARAVAFSMVRNYHDMEDIVQDVYVVLLRGGIEKYNPKRGPFPPWVAAVTANRTRDILRSRKGAPLAHLVVSMEDPDFDVTRYLPDRRERYPLDTVLLEDQTRVLRKDIEGIPEPLGLTARLRYFGELTYQKLSEVLEIPIGTVKSRLHSVHKILKELEERRQEQYLGLPQTASF